MGKEEIVDKEVITCSRSIWPQHLAALLATLSSLSGGTVMGWSTPAIPYLQGDGRDNTTSFVPITDEEGSWLGSLSAIGALVGAIPAGLIADSIGRKKTLLISAVPFVVSWIMLMFVEDSVTLMEIARFISGIGLGAATVISPIYNEEIADVEIRGSLGTYNEIMLCVGILYAFCVGSYLPYLWFHIASCAVPVIFCLTFFWMPESPVYLVMKDKASEAELALRWFRGAGKADDPGIKDEMKAIDRFIMDSKPQTGNIKFSETIRAFMKHFSLSSPTFKVAYIVFGLMILQQMSGTCAFMYYAVNVFLDAGTSLSPYSCSIIVASVQVIGGFAASRTVDHAGRRPLLLFSECSLVLCLVTMVVYTFVKQDGTDVSSYSWIPLLALNVYVVTFEFGIGTLPWLMMAELAPGETRGFISGSSVCLNWILVFIVTKCFTNMIDGIGLAMSYGVFAIVSMCGIVFVFFLVPETKGKTREVIQHELKFGKKDIDV